MRLLWKGHLSVEAQWVPRQFETRDAGLCNKVLCWLHVGDEFCLYRVRLHAPKLSFLGSPFPNVLPDKFKMHISLDPLSTG